MPLQSPPKYTAVSLFSGIGGFDISAQWNGIETEVFCEKDKQCQEIIKRHWPDVPIVSDIRDFDGSRWRRIFLLTAGDPCPCRSRAKSIWGTKHPDLSGYVLAVVGSSRPKWVVRENVPASDDVEFIAALDSIGYGSVVVSGNATSFTAQNRERDFIVACHNPEKIWKFTNCLPVSEDGRRYAETKYQKVPAYPVLTTNPCRWDARDGYIWDGEGLRVADSKERLALAGFPDGWLDGLSKTTVARMTGNSVVPQVAAEIIKAIVESEI